MEGKLLSIVVPTKNRTKYMISLIKLCNLFNRDDFELVVQDNSDTNELAKFLDNNRFSFVVYNYDPTPMPVIRNCDLAIKNSNGKYVCFVGDDDLLSKYLIDFVSYMDKNDIETAIFRVAIYSWPGMLYMRHKFPNLIIRSFTGKLTYVDVNKMFDSFLKHGATGLSFLPQLYHGVVRRDILDKVYDNTGTYFPGPSPDMAIAVALSYFVKSHVLFDMPLVSSGKSPKSAAGLGAKHMHKGALREMAFLPPDIEQRWDHRIPMIWTGATIYIESALEAIKVLKREKDIERLNFPYFFASFDSFTPEYKNLSSPLKREQNINSVLYYCYRIKIFLKRVKIYLNNKLLLHLKTGGYLFDNIDNTVEAQAIIDSVIDKECPYWLNELNNLRK